MAAVNELYKEHELLKREGKVPEAIAKLEELLQQDPKHVLTHNVHGFARYVSGVSGNATLPSKSGRNAYNGGIDRNRSL